MANVAFRKGTAQALGSVTPVNGTFYFTTDSHKLYLADNDALVDLTHFINYINNQASLPSSADDGDMYYITSDNILCIRNRSAANGWTQINPNTTLIPSNAMVAVNTVTNGVSVSSTVSDTANNTVSGSFSIIEGNGNIHIEKVGSSIKISSDNNADDHQSELTAIQNSDGGTIRLTETLNGTETGHNDIAFVGSGEVTVTSSPSTGITIDVPTKQVATSVSFNNAGLMTVSSTLGATGSAGTATPTIAYGKPATEGGAAPESEVFKSGTATLDVYTTGQVDALLTSLESTMDAMTYKGTLDENGASAKLASTAGNVGDTYKLSETFIYGGKTYRTGDLIIAKGTDGNVIWEVIPSGDDQVVGGSVSTTGFAVTDGLASGNLLDVHLNGTASGASGAGIVVSGVVNRAAANGVGAEATYTISHGPAGTGTAQTFTTTATNPTVDENANVTNVASTLDVYSISGISLDSNGHVTNLTTSKYAIKDTHNHIRSLGIGASVTNNVASVGFTVTNTDGDSATQNFVIQTSEATPATNGGLQITRPQGDANTVQIDMVWGEF